MSDPISLVIADDHPIFRQGLRQVLERDPGLVILGEAGDGEEALRLIERIRPRVAILDIDMPGRDGVSVAEAVRDRGLATAIVCLTMHNDSGSLQAALDVGVMGYVVKDGALLEIVESVKAVAAGRHHVSPQLSTYLIARRSRADDLVRGTPGLDSLTEAERKVLRLLAQFKTTKEIATALGISPRTVNHHREHMVEKLGLSGTHALTKFAVEHRPAL